MLVKHKITSIDVGQTFYYAGKAYVLADADERRKHPAKEVVRDVVLAYHVPDRGDRIPVTFNPLVEVYVDRK